jgi:hypothetical protein
MLGSSAQPNSLSPQGGQYTCVTQVFGILEAFNSDEQGSAGAIKRAGDVDEPDMDCLVQRSERQILY